MSATNLKNVAPVKRIGAVSPAAREMVEDDAGEDAAERIGQDDGADGLPAGGAEIPARFAKGLRHRAERFARAGDDDGQVHHGDGERSGEQAGLPL